MPTQSRGMEHRRGSAASNGPARRWPGRRGKSPRIAALPGSDRRLGPQDNARNDAEPVTNFAFQDPWPEMRSMVTWSRLRSDRGGVGVDPPGGFEANITG